MSDTVRGTIIFFAVLLTIGLWAPLRNKPERLSTGVIVTETYFGFLTYLTLRAEFKEPDYKMQWQPHFPKLGLTALASTALWAAAVAITKRRRTNTRASEFLISDP